LRKEQIDSVCFDLAGRFPFAERFTKSVLLPLPINILLEEAGNKVVLNNKKPISLEIKRHLSS